MKRNKQYRVRLDEPEHTALIFASKCMGVPASDILRGALLEYYKNHRHEMCENIKEGRIEQ